MRQNLEARLPQYLVPTVIAIRDALPLTGNGKTDFAALLRDTEELARAVAAGPAALPETELEGGIARVVEEVLEIERASVTGNFFDLGATSLRVVQIQRRLREGLGIEVPIVEMFRNPKRAESWRSGLGKGARGPRTRSTAFRSSPASAGTHAAPAAAAGRKEVRHDGGCGSESTRSGRRRLAPACALADQARRGTLFPELERFPIWCEGRRRRPGN